MVIGLISDVHANVLALEAALDELKRRGVDTIICLGDIVGYGPSPNETIEMLRREQVMCALGTADEKVAFPFAGQGVTRKGVADEILEWTRSVIEPHNVAFLSALPAQLRLDTPQGRLRAFHKAYDSHRRIDLSGDAAVLETLLEAQRCAILAVGDSHVPMYRRLGGGWLINPGSVGLSLNGEPGADFALLRFEGGELTVEMDKVEYDFAAVAFDIIAWGLPSAVAQAVQNGRMPDTL